MTSTLGEQIAALEQAIAAQESLRPTLGDAVVDAAVAALRRQLDALRQQLGAPEAHAATQQRKLVTVLFADVSGFSAMVEALDPELVGDTLNALWVLLDAAITEHGGWIDKHIGDAVMALWGVEQAREDDPERAIHAALAMQQACRAWREQEGEDAALRAAIAIRVGVHTGLALLGDVGTTGEFTAIGDTVNLTARLEHAAPVNGVLISHATYRHVRGVFDVQPQVPLQVKGRAEPVQAYLVERAKPRAFRMGTRGVEGVETRMVGREDEVAALHDAFRRSLESSQTQAITLAGEAGVGKSRLLYEFSHWLELLPERIYYLKGRATPETGRVPYGLFRDLFRWRFDIQESDSAAEALAKFRAGMAGVLNADQADLVGHLVGFDFSESPMVRNLLGTSAFARLARAYLVHYVRARAASAPVVLLLDDLHWADESSLDLLDHVIQTVSEARLTVVGLARPRLFERRAGWGEGWRHHVRLDLHPLPESQSRALVDEILKKAQVVPESLRRWVVRGAGGNPYYIEELIKMLVEEGVIQPGPARWSIVGERVLELIDTSLRVPPTLVEILQARLDKLSPEERETLQRASVVGRHFWDQTVAALHAPNDRVLDVPSALKAAWDRELIFRRDLSVFAGAQEYIFKHGLLWDVVYNSVLLKLRRVYHAQVAAWLEAHAGERIGEYLTLIAEHYERAGDRVKTVDCLRRAGKELENLSNFRDAASLYERALDLVPEDDAETRATLLVRLGWCSTYLSQYPVAIAAFEQGAGLARRIKARAVVVEALNGLSAVAARQGDHAQTRAYAQEALTLAQAAGAGAGVAVALRGLGNVAWVQGEYVEARRYYERALDVNRELEDRRAVASNLKNLGTLACVQGEFDVALRCFEQSLALNREHGDRWGIAGSLNNIGTVASMRGDYAAAKRCYEDSLVFSREIGDPWGIAISLNNLGLVASEQGDYAAARRYHEESLSLKRQIGNRQGIVTSLSNLGHVAFHAGDDADAWAYFREALVGTREIGALPMLLEALAGIAGLLSRAGDHERAAAWLGLVLNHPALTNDTRRVAEEVLAPLQSHLSSSAFAASLARGQALDLPSVVDEAIAEAERRANE